MEGSFPFARALWSATSWSRSAARMDPENAALGRNCSHFERVRLAAYALVDRYRNVRDEAGFAQRVRELVDTANAGEPEPLGDRECAGIARSISRWTWNVYRRGAAAAQAHQTQAELTRAEYLRAQAIARREARRLHADGLSPTVIAKRLERSRSWVYLALREPVDEESSPTVQSPSLSGLVREGKRGEPPEPVPSLPPTVASLAAFLARRSPSAAAAFLAARAQRHLSPSLANARPVSDCGPHRAWKAKYPDAMLQKRLWNKGFTAADFYLARPP